MKYCQFCGAQLEDGAQCTCKGAWDAAVQQAAAEQVAAAQRAAAAQQQRPAAQKPVLTQEQKEEMQKTMAEAKESAKAAGKVLWNSAKAYGASFAETAQSTLSNGAAAQGGAPAAALYRKIMMGFGALQILFFFILSYAKLDGSGAVVKSIAKYMGIDVPRRLTGLNYLRLINGCAEYGIPNAEEALIGSVVLFGLPVVCGILLIVFNRKEKVGGGMLSSIILSALTFLSYLGVHGDLSGNVEMLGYETGLGFGFVFLVTVLQTAAAVIGHRASKKAAAAA